MSSSLIPKKYKRGATKRAYKVAARVGNAIKKRYVQNNKINLTSLMNDVAKLKLLMNVEKKRIDVNVNAIALGQSNINLTGASSVDVTPLVVQGTAYNQRTGASVKLVSAYIKWQFYNQTANNHATKVCIEAFLVKGASQNVSTFLVDYFTPSTMSGVIDYNSMRDPDYVGQAKLLFSKQFICPASNYSGQVMIKDVVQGLKFQHHVRYDQNSTTVDDGQIIMVMRADSGNAAGTISTLTGVPILLANSGLTCNFDFKYYYVDN